jgi:hypothetical protein
LALEIVLLKRIIVGRARTRSFGFVSLDLLLLLQAQVRGTPTLNAKSSTLNPEASVLNPDP